MRWESRGQLERECRQKTGYWYLGGGVGMCLVLGGKKMFVPTRDVSLVPHLIAEGFWEAWITVWIANQLRAGEVFVDCGANVGYYALLAAGLGAYPVAVEANSELAGLVKKTIAVNGFAARVSDRAAWHEPDVEMVLNVPGDFLGGTSVELAEDHEGVEGVETVLTTTVDDLVADLEMPVGLIKIDVEGAEGCVIDGAMKTLRANPDAVVLAEINEDLPFWRFFNETFREVSVVGSDGRDQKVLGDEVPEGLRMIVGRGLR